jgi:hypothetical protein
VVNGSAQYCNAMPDVKRNLHLGRSNFAYGSRQPRAGKPGRGR